MVFLSDLKQLSSERFQERSFRGNGVNSRANSDESRQPGFFITTLEHHHCHHRHRFHYHYHHQDSVPLTRPPLEKLENCMDVVKETMAVCWAENPESRLMLMMMVTCWGWWWFFNLRPDFKMIRSRLRPLRKGMKSNIFDNMIRSPSSISPLL